MLRPFLLVGIGGSGGKTLRVIRDDLMRRLRQAESPDGERWTKDDLPKAWQFLHIDVPTIDDTDDVDLPPRLPERNYKGLVKPGIEYVNLDKALLTKGGTSVRDALATWRPNPSNVKQSPSKGAGQFRALGRVIALTGIEDIQRAVQEATREMTGTGVVAELQDVTRLLGGEATATPAEPVVIVVSSIAGGTGAGTVIDVCDVIRALPYKWASESVGFLYAPDVFNGLPEEARKGVRANALGTIAELLNGYWNNVGPSEETTNLFQANQVTLSQTSLRSGPRYPFLIGAANDRVSYKSQNDIYRAMGRSIASWVASENLQNAITAYLGGNWSQINIQSDKLPLRTAHSESPFTAIGSARVGLGRDRFLEYASQYLARSVMDRMADEHNISSRRGVNDDRTDKQLISDLETAMRPGFREETELDELGPDRNQILNALRGDTNAAGQKYLAQVNNAVSQTIGITKRGASARDAVQRAAGAVREAQGGIDGELWATTLVNAKNWIPYIQKHVTNVTARRLAENGAPVTHALLKNLISNMDEVRAGLTHEEADLKRVSQDYDARVHEALNSNEKTLITTASDPLVQKVASDAINASIARYEAGLRERAQMLVGELTEQFLKPLARAIGNADEKVEVARSSGNSQYAIWPLENTIPKVAQNELLLQDPAEYSKDLTALIQRTKGPDANEKEARRSAEIAILLGVPDTDELDQQNLIQIEDMWVPEDSALKADYASPRQARFRIAVSPEDVVARAEQWVTREGTPIGKFMRETLSDYLSPKDVAPADHERRLNNFIGKVGSALDAAAPLVKINPAVLVAVHGKDRVRYTNSFSEIPLPRGSEARARLQKLLESRGDWSPEVEKAFTEKPGVNFEIFTMLNEAYQPVVFDSLMKPIADDWGQKSKTPSAREEFWRWRRARPLAEFIPVARSTGDSILDNMIRGWFVATRLGQLRKTADKAEIYLPETATTPARWAPFPTPMLSPEDLRGPAGIAVTLAAIMVALLQVNSRESVEPLDAYARLAQLGRSQGGFHQDLNEELKSWILDGTNTNPSLTVAASNVSDTPAVRQEQVAAELEKLKAQYEAHFAKIEKTHFTPNDYPREWDLRGEILSALDYLIHAVNAVDTIADAGGWS